MTPNQWAAVSGGAAIVQVLAAGLSLYAAMRIARRQERRADMADERAARAVAAERARVAAEEAARLQRFLAAVKGVGVSATSACLRMADVLACAGKTTAWAPAGYNWNRQMAEAASALQALRPIAPPDANLALILARLQAALDARRLADLFMLDGLSVLPTVQEHKGSLSLALTELDIWGKPAVTLADVQAAAAPEPPSTASL